MKISHAKHEIDDFQDYAHMTLVLSSGQRVEVRVKSDDDGLVVDVFDINGNQEEAIASTWVAYNDIEPGDYVSDAERKAALNIPESLDRWFLSRGWPATYWEEIPIKWKDMGVGAMKRYPITKEILDWQEWINR